MDNITIYKNKGETFKCQFKIDGAEIKDTSVRLCLEFNSNRNMYFNGKLKESGECEIEIPKLKDLEEKNGRLVVEAIADSVYFQLYEANVEFKNSVEVSVVKLEQKAVEENTAKIELKEITQEKKKAKPKKEEVVMEEVKEVEKSNPYLPTKPTINKLKSFDQYRK